MNRIRDTFGLVILAGATLIAGCSKKQHQVFSLLKDPETAAQLRNFVAEKKAQANASTNEAAPGFTPFFAAAQSGDWLAVSNDFLEFRKHAGQFEYSGYTNDERLRGTRWEVVKEVWGAFDAFGEGDEKYSTAFGNDIIESIPPGSIYFGGTDPGRFLITAMCKSQVSGDPFFLLTQNALTDATYLQYLREMYGEQIYIPSTEDSQRCFDDYTKDFAIRRQRNQLKPGEDAQTNSSGKILIAGPVAVMQVNGLIAKAIFEKNTNQEFYIEESFPFDWMYPQLEPHGLIFKLDRQPMTKLPEKVVQKDHEYWAKYVQPMIGDWLRDDTSVAEVAAFAEIAFGRHDFSGFKVDPRFIQNAYSHKMFSKLRSSIAGLYRWRVSHAADLTDKERMACEADFAFRQAWALSPYSPEAAYPYVNFLLAQNRSADALLVAETVANMPEMQGDNGEQARNIVKQLQQWNQQSKAK